MPVLEVGRFLSLVGLVTAGWSAVHFHRHVAVGWRLVAAVGEVVYFWTPWAKLGGVLFVLGVAMTVYHMVQGTSWPSGIPQRRKDAIELIELIAWLWMLEALH